MNSKEWDSLITSLDCKGVRQCCCPVKLACSLPPVMPCPPLFLPPSGPKPRFLGNWSSWCRPEKAQMAGVNLVGSLVRFAKSWWEECCGMAHLQRNSVLNCLWMYGLGFASILNMLFLILQNSFLASIFWITYHAEFICEGVCCSLSLLGITVYL